MSSRSLPVVLSFALALSACGFEPIAATNGHSLGQQTIVLADLDLDVSIDTDEERFKYLLRQEFEKSIRFDSVSDHTLALDIVVEREGLAIEQNDTVTRFNLTATTDYDLRNGETDPLLMGETVSITALSATASQFTTSISERDALRQLAVDIARRITTLMRLHYQQNGV